MLCLSTRFYLRFKFLKVLLEISLTIFTDTSNQNCSFFLYDDFRKIKMASLKDDKIITRCDVLHLQFRQLARLEIRASSKIL